MKHYISFFIFLLILVSCQQKKVKDNRKQKLEVLSTDISFSDYSKKNGMNKAFLAFADKKAVMLKDNSYPVSGYSKLNNFLNSSSDTSFILTWRPIKAIVSESNDLAYTYGIYKLQRLSGGYSEGTYVTIWKKQKDGSWKWILDSGNQNLK